MTLPVTLPNVYDLIVTKANHGDPSIRWRNTMTFFSLSVPTPTTPIVAAILGWNNGSTWPDTDLVEVSCYNWSRGRLPYPTGTAIFTETLSLPGTANTVWTHLGSPYDPVGGEVCLRIDHIPEAPGRDGRTFLRGLLGSLDIAAISGGRWILTSTVANLQANLNSLNSLTALDAHFSSGLSSDKLVIVRYSPKTETVHGSDEVAALSVVGVTTNKRSRANRR